MTLLRMKRFSAAVVVAAGSLLFVDMFLHWHEISVQTPMVNVAAGTTGWHGAVGVFLGIAVILLVLREGRYLGSVPEGDEPHGFRTALLGVAVVGLTIAQFLHTATVTTTMVAIDAGTRNWPAWVGLLLAVLVGVAAFVPYIASACMRATPRTHAPRAT